MDNSDLLNRIKSKDREAFLQLMQTYGKGLYSRLLSQLGDRELADAAFKETLVGFYNTLTENDGGDAVEALLYGYADRTRRQLLDSSLEHVIDETMDETADEAGPASAPPAREAAAAVPETVKEPESADEPESDEICDEAEDRKNPGGAGFWIAVIALGLCIMFAVWVIVGLLMDMSLLPEFDLGYDWFNANVAPWF